jgi:hypothetical protein
MENKLWNKIPFDVFVNNIMPYAYQKIDSNLSNDLRNFVFDYNIIINYYYLDLNEYCLLIDLIWFCNSVPLNTNIHYKFIDILDRNTSFKKLSLDEKREYINEKFNHEYTLKTTNKNKFLLSLLTPVERARFINKYIIIY